MIPGEARNALRQSIRVWPAVSVGGLSLMGNAWLFSTVAFGWPSRPLPTRGGAIVVPLCFVAGLGVFAAAAVAFRRHRDWRLALAAAFGLAGVVLLVVSFLIATRGVTG